jgi:hypothetical protein
MPLATLFDFAADVPSARPRLAVQVVQWGVAPHSQVSGWADNDAADLMPLRGLDSRVLTINVVSPTGSVLHVSDSATPIIIAIPALQADTVQVQPDGSLQAQPVPQPPRRSVVFTCPPLDAAEYLRTGDALPVVSVTDEASPSNDTVWLESVTGTSDEPTFNVVVECGALLGGRAAACGAGFYGSQVSFDCPAVEFVPVCGYWNTSLSAWATDGCVAVALVPGGAVVETTHLTDFALRFAAVAESNRDVFLETIAREFLFVVSTRRHIHF